MTTLHLRQWLSSIKYHDVRHVEHSMQVLLPHGGRLRGLRIIRKVWLGRDKQFYFVETGATYARPMALDEVLSMVSLLAIQLRWKVAVARQTQRMPAIKERRRRVVASRRH